eukprot:GHVS01078822.1.p1 GENE.GHVS01078822.1~~GHVS01078822.1.p1  ORF type:complete len:726 (-),score=63.12 GHVS01078822.1:96-2273(-)
MEHCPFSYDYHGPPHRSYPAFNSRIPSSLTGGNPQLLYPIPPTFKPLHPAIPHSRQSLSVARQSFLRLPVCTDRPSPAGHPPSFIASPLSTASTVTSTLRHRFYQKRFADTTAGNPIGSPTPALLSALIFPQVGDSPSKQTAKSEQSTNQIPTGRERNETICKTLTVGGLYVNCATKLRATKEERSVQSKIRLRTEPRHCELRRRHSTSSISSIESLSSIQTSFVSQHGSSVYGTKNGQRAIVQNVSGPLVQQLRTNRTRTVGAEKEPTGCDDVLVVKKRPGAPTVKQHNHGSGSTSVVQCDKGGADTGAVATKEGGGFLQNRVPPEKHYAIATARTRYGQADRGTADTHGRLARTNKREAEVSSHAGERPTTARRTNAMLLVGEVVKTNKGTQTDEEPEYLPTVSLQRLHTETSRAKGLMREWHYDVPQLDGLQDGGASETQWVTLSSNNIGTAELGFDNEATSDSSRGVVEAFGRVAFHSAKQTRIHVKATALFSDGGPVDIREVSSLDGSSQSQDRVYPREAWGPPDSLSIKKNWSGVHATDDAQEWVLAVERILREAAQACHLRGSSRQMSVEKGSAQKSQKAACLLMSEDFPQGNEGRLPSTLVSTCSGIVQHDYKILLDRIDERRQQIYLLRESCAQISRHLSVGETYESRDQLDNAARSTSKCRGGHTSSLRSGSGSSREKRCRRKGFMRSIISAVTESASELTRTTVSMCCRTASDN